MREPGYYWVRAPWNEWMIAEFGPYRWTNCGSDEEHNDLFWIEIDERRITRSNEEEVNKKLKNFDEKGNHIPALWTPKRNSKD
jgi:hypothetical protein